MVLLVVVVVVIGSAGVCFEGWGDSDSGNSLCWYSYDDPLYWPREEGVNAMMLHNPDTCQKIRYKKKKSAWQSSRVTNGSPCLLYNMSLCMTTLWFRFSACFFYLQKITSKPRVQEIITHILYILNKLVGVELVLFGQKFNYLIGILIWTLCKV